MSTSQIQGFTTANILEVEANTRAARVTFRPEDYGTLGIYGNGLDSGVMAAGLANNAPVWSCRWGNASNLMAIKRVVVSAGSITAFAAGIAKFDLFVARAYTVNDTGGTAFTPSSNTNKLRTSMGTSLLTDLRMSATATLTAGTRTLDANPLASVCGGVTVTAGTGILSPWALFDQRPGEHPLILAQNEGLVLQATVPASGTWTFSVKFDWSELAAY